MSALAGTGAGCLAASASAATGGTASAHVGAGLSLPRAGPAFESAAARGGRLPATALLDTNSPALLDARSSAFFNDAPPLDTDAPAFFNDASSLDANTAAFPDGAFRGPAVPTGRPAPSEAGTKSVAAPVPARPTPAVIVETVFAARPSERDLLDHRLTLHCTRDSAVRNRRGL